MSEIPVLQDEINRKAMDTLTWLALSLQRGSITPEQYSTGVDALWMAVSGLVSDPDFVPIMSVANGIASISEKR